MNEHGVVTLGDGFISIKLYRTFKYNDNLLGLALVGNALHGLSDGFRIAKELH